jgi:hypothetical protein
MKKLVILLILLASCKPEPNQIGSVSCIDGQEIEGCYPSAVSLFCDVSGDEIAECYWIEKQRTYQVTMVEE